jgi:hypothetical protein
MPLFCEYLSCKKNKEEEEEVDLDFEEREGKKRI